MVKTTYALTLFVAMSLAAPLPPVGNDATSIGHVRRDGTGNLIGAGTADGAVNEMIKGITTPKSNHPDGEDKKGKKAAEIKAADQKEKEKKPVVTHSPLEALPLVGPLLRPVPLKRDIEARSFTGDLSNLPLLGSIFGGNQNHPANSPHQNGGGQKVGVRRGYPETDIPQNYGQNSGQNAGQNEGQNEGENYLQNYGQNEGQNWGQNHGQNEGQNMEKRGKPAQQTESLGALWLIHKLTSGSSEQINHKRDMDSEDLDEPASRDTSDGGAIADAVNDALDSGIDQSSDAADMAMPVRRDLSGLTAGLTKMEGAPQPGQSKSQPQSAKGDKKNDPLAKLAKEAGLSGLFASNTHHGLGLLPMNGRRDVHENEARGGSPIQGSDLPSVLFSGGVLGKLGKVLSPAGGQ